MSARSAAPNRSSRTLTRCTKLRAVGTTRKRAITLTEIKHAHNLLASSLNLDDLLFLAICHTSFHALLRLGESVWPDKAQLRDYRKVILRSTVAIFDDQYTFILPGHKADRLYEGSRILILLDNAGSQCLAAFSAYLRLRDDLFPFKPELWLRHDGSIPRRAWFLKMLKQHFPGNDIGGHSFRPGGATHLASQGVPPSIIRGMGRWKSAAFETYIRKHPALLAALLYTSATTTSPDPS